MLKMPANERLLWFAVALVLPLQPLAFYFVRLPLDHWLVTQLGSASATYQWLTSLYTPLTEEPAKLLPLLIPAIRHDIRAANFIRYALPIGVGFAIGEIWSSQIGSPTRLCSPECHSISSAATSESG
jgi:RsiW-degrading membrane proteinase PrsW (M82 family)